MDTTGLRSREILNTEAELVLARKVLDAAQAAVAVHATKVRNLRDEFWTKAVATVDLENAEDLMVVSSEAWDRGHGNSILTKELETWVHEKSKYLYANGGWQSIDETNDDNISMLVTISLHLPCTIPSHEALELASAIKSLAKVHGEIAEAYRFAIMENSCGEKGSYTLQVAKDVATVGVRHWGSQNDQEFVGTVEEAIVYISKNLSYCQCGKHSSEEDDYDY